MKKILSLVLAAAMLTTTAFAADNYIGNGLSGQTEDVTISNPDSSLYVSPEDFESKAGASLKDIGWRLATENFTVTAKFDKGSALVKEVKINDDKNAVQIVLKDNVDLVRPNGENLVIKEIALKAKKAFPAKGDSPEITKTTYYYGGNKDLFVGYKVTESELDGTPEYDLGNLTKFINTTANNVPYETATLTEGDISIEGRVYKGDKCFIDIDYDVNKEVLKTDDTASMRFYNVTTNQLPTANSFQLGAEEDEFVYKIVDGKLTPSGLKWSADDYAWVGKIRSTTSYVVSDVELKNVAAEGDKPATTNPDTGANDVVGIAAALAVVSLVAAGAVSLKK